MSDISGIIKNQIKFFNSGRTLDIDFRVEKLKILKNTIIKYEGSILKALKDDLNKSEFEAYETEVGIVLEELSLTIKKLRKWNKDIKIKSSILHYKTKSYIHSEPYGVVLNIAPWNYPFQLLMAPLIGIIAGGNCAMLKPSKYAPKTTEIIGKIIDESFDHDYISVVEGSGGRESISALLDLRFDYIFFTGSVKVGKIVMEAASKNLTPVTLELGGKSPCIVDKDANLELSAKRIVWGKLLNAGQTCVAPDYLLVHKEIKDKFLKLLVSEINKQFGEDIEKSLDYPRIVREDDVLRLKNYLNEGTIYFGGEYKVEDKYMMPTILTDISESSAVMTDEIFGPIFPVMEFEKLDEALDFVNNREKPLALYYFSNSDSNVEYVLRNTTSGGVTINDTVIHVAFDNLPFGGVGNSGIGSYHGKASFDTFTHRKSVVKRSTFIEFPLRFAPFKDKIKLLRKVMK